MKYNLVISGGTFDRLHQGHVAFLRYAFSLGEKVIIGLTSDKYVKENKKDPSILSFQDRKNTLESFLQKKGFLDRAIIASIDSKFDQTQIPNVGKTALLVTPDTQGSVLEINAARKHAGLATLEIVVMPLVTNNRGEKISSSQIRQEETFPSKTLYLPEFLRAELRKPFGVLFTKDIPKQFLRNPGKIVTVGDITTKRIHDLGLLPKLAVIDFVVERKKTHETLSQLGFMGTEKVIHIHNPAGQLVHGLWTRLSRLAKGLKTSKNTIIIIDGEEDLLVIPLVIVLPLGMYIFYGQPQKGVVVLEVTAELKKRFQALLQNFTLSP